jgi:hypothetical protein
MTEVGFIMLGFILVDVRWCWKKIMKLIFERLRFLVKKNQKIYYIEERKG